VLEDEPIKVRGYNPYDTASTHRSQKDIWRFKPKRT
jgi:hypothetical protein